MTKNNLTDQKIKRMLKNELNDNNKIDIIKNRIISEKERHYESKYNDDTNLYLENHMQNNFENNNGYLFLFNKLKKAYY